MILKILGNEVAIDSSNTVANSNLVRIINTGASANLSIITGSTIFANITISNTETVIVEKDNDQKLQGAGMRAVPVAYKA
jgi:hypothetical protein